MRSHILLLICACAHAAVTNVTNDSTESTVNYHEEIAKCNSEEDQTTVVPKLEPQKETVVHEIGINPLQHNDQILQNLTQQVIAEGLYDNTEIIPEINNLTDTYNNSILNYTEIIQSSDEIITNNNETNNFDPIEVLIEQHEKYHSIINQYKTEFEKLLEVKEIERHMYEKRIAQLENLLLEKRHSSEGNEDTSNDCDCPCMRAKRDVSRKRSRRKEPEIEVPQNTKKLNNEEFYKHMEKMNRKHIKALEKIRSNFKALYEASISSSESIERQVNSEEIRKKLEEIKRKYNLETTPEVVVEAQLNSADTSTVNVKRESEDIAVEDSIETPLINLRNTEPETQFIRGEITIDQPKNMTENVETIIHVISPIETPIEVVNSTQSNVNDTKVNKENEETIIEKSETLEKEKEIETESSVEEDRQEKSRGLFGFGLSFNLTDGFKVHWNNEWPKTGPVNNRPAPNGGYIPK